MIILSIIIPSYNRPLPLERCLSALLIQDVNMDQCEIIVVDNGTDSSSELVSKIFRDKFTHFKYIKEPIAGSSIARNAGSRIAKAKWILFLDDDGVVRKNAVRQCLKLVLDRKADIIGGLYLPLYLTPKPRWFKDSMGSNALRSRSNFFRLLNKTEYASGGIMLVKKSILKKVGYFPETIGIFGSALGYGEETYMQLAARRLGYHVGFDSSLVMDHEVKKCQYSLRWQLKSSWLMGINHYFLLPHTLRLILNRIVGIFIINPAITIKKLFLADDYYYENAILDSIQPIIYFIGQIAGILNHSERE